jgi:hypothetical protein
MLTKIPKKGLNVILIASIIGLGSGSYIPTAFAESETTVQADPTANTLSNIKIEGINLDKDFSADVKEYSTTVESGVQAISLLVESSNLNSVITINDQIITNGTASSYPLQTGENTFHINVNGGNQPETTYTLTVKRTQNANTLLQTINLSTGEFSPLFSSEQTEYTVEVTNDTTTITVTPVAIEKTATVAVNGMVAAKEGVLVEIPIGKSDIQLVVIAENGLKKTYILHVTRAEKNNTPPSNPGSHQLASNLADNGNGKFQPSSQQQITGTVQKVSKATLSSLTVSEGTWDSTFSMNEFTYHVAVASDVETMTITPIASYSGSTILIDGSTSKTIQLEDDSKTIISVVVTSGVDDRKTYILVFDKAE